MRLRSPAELYIKYLLSSPENFTDEAIIEILTEKALDFIDAKYILRLRERLRRPLPFRPQDKLHQASCIFILKEGLFYLYRQDPGMKLAFRILDTPRAKEFIETMLLSRAPEAAIAAELKRSHRIDATTVSIDRYRRFFWNIDLLDSTQMRALMAYRVEISGNEGENSTKEDRAMKSSLKKASWLDSRRIAADLPNSPMVALMAQMRMGLMPGRLELAYTLQVARAVSAVRVAEAALYGGERDSHRALNYSIVMKTAGEVLDTVVKPDEALRQDLERISLKTDLRPVPSIHQLSDGHHTVEITPKNVSSDGSSPAGPDEFEEVGGELGEAEDDSADVP